MSKDSLKIADDDHPKRPDISKEEFMKACDELYEKHKNDSPATKDNEEFSKKIAQATIDALSKL